MIRVLIKPAKRLFSRRRQWTWEIRGANGELLDPSDTYNNRGDAVEVVSKLLTGDEPVELVIYDEYGNADIRRRIRG